MNYVKYFDFEMLNKHSNEQIQFISGLFYLGIYVTVIYILVKLFIKYDK